MGTVCMQHPHLHAMRIPASVQRAQCAVLPSVFYTNLSQRTNAQATTTSQPLEVADTYSIQGYGLCVPYGVLYVLLFSNVLSFTVKCHTVNERGLYQLSPNRVL